MGPITEDQKLKIINFLLEGKSREDISERMKVSPRTVSAIKAHITMGTYGTDILIEEAETTFGLERDLQTALRSNIEQLELGLNIIDNGKEKSVEAGRIDITAKDKNGSVVVVELKAGEAGPDSITQLLAYMASFQEEENPVRGLLVAGEFNKKVKLAASVVHNIELVKYSFNFSFQSIE